jgi:arylsulfatase A-like enzyme
VDFSNDAFWKELQELNTAGKLSSEQSRLYFSPTRQIFELYDLQNDPSELKNLSGLSETAELEHDLKLKLTEWMILERDYVPLPLPAEIRPDQPRRAAALPSASGVGKE